MIQILEIRDNVHLINDVNHPSFGTMDVQCTNGLDIKWISIPYELLFEFICNSDQELKSYFDKFHTFEPFIEHLYDIGYDLDDQIYKYIESSINDFIFTQLPTYNPDYLAEFDL